MTPGATWPGWWTAITCVGSPIRLRLACTGRAWGDFVVWRESGLNVSRVTHDPAWLTWDIAGVGMSTGETLLGFMEEYELTIGDEELARPHREPLTDIRVDDG